MVEINPEIIQYLMKAVRAKSENAKEEVEGLANACLMDMSGVGIHIKEIDANVKQCMALYCKGNYGYGEGEKDDQDKFHARYEKLRDAMSLRDEYRKGEADG